jgi:hypothetical protein
MHLHTDDFCGIWFTCLWWAAQVLNPVRPSSRRGFSFAAPVARRRNCFGLWCCTGARSRPAGRRDVANDSYCISLKIHIDFAEGVATTMWIHGVFRDVKLPQDVNRNFLREAAYLVAPVVMDGDGAR